MDVKENGLKRIISILKEKTGVEIASGDQLDLGVRKWLSTGIWAVDWMLGGKGLPYGRIVEVYGDFSSGKSWLGLVVLKRAIENGDLAILIETEGAYDPDFAKLVGVDVSKLVVISPDSLEQVYKIMSAIFEEAQDVPAVVVWDSLAATPTEHELESGLDVRDMTKALRMSQILRLITRKVEETDGLLFVINQVREAIGVMFGEKELAPGGRAMSFHSSVRLKMMRSSRIIDPQTKEVIGQKFRIECVKSKVCIPFRHVEVSFVPGKPIPVWEGVLDILKRKGFVVEKGGWYTFVGGDKKWRESQFGEIIMSDVGKEIVRKALGVEV